MARDPDRERTALVFAANEGAAAPLAVAFRTTFSHLPRNANPEVYVLDNGLSGASRSRLEGVVGRVRSDLELGWVPVPAERLSNLKIDPRFTDATFSRLLIPELLPPDVDRVLYLDADILVRDDISPLLATDLEDAPVGAVADFLPRPGHFNAGILLMDITRWRSENLGRQVLEYAAANQKLDQDALNAVLRGRWHELDLRWNTQHGQLFVAELPGIPNDFTKDLYRRRWELYRDAAILHFVGGPAKPWYHWCEMPGTTAWVSTLIRTRFYTPRESAAWLARWTPKRARFLLGTARRRWRTRIRQASSRLRRRASA